MTNVIATIDQFRAQTDHHLATGFVPTLGALHQGHISLIKKSMQENERTVVSLFLNPTQFDDSNDLDNYPKTYKQDKEILDALGVDIIFKPNKNELYPDSYTYKIIETEISHILCGKTRPGHFDGVLTIVMKLFNIIKPQKAYFGEKDFQQYLLIKHMVKAYFLDIDIVPCPIVREPSGLALSSRNQLLKDDHRKIAPYLHKELSSKEPVQKIKTNLVAHGFKVDYLEEHFGRRFVAAFLGSVRLIDNVKI